jgi:cholesterol 7-dehydrogenase
MGDVSKNEIYVHTVCTNQGHVNLNLHVSVNVQWCVLQIGPAYVELYLTTSLGVVIILQTVTPVEPLLQKVEHRIYCPPSLALFANFILYGESVMVSTKLSQYCMHAN